MNLLSIIEQDDKSVEKVEEKPEDKPTIPLGPADEYNRCVPSGSVYGFMDAADKGDYESAAKYLDMGNLPKYVSRSRGPGLARKFQIVLERALWIGLDALNFHPEGHTDDGLIPKPRPCR